jgi:hypothetical protein
MKKRIHNLLGPVVLIVLFAASAHAQRVMPYHAGITDGSSVNVMVEYNGQLVLGGDFKAFNGHERRNLQGWDGTDHYDYPGAFQNVGFSVNDLVVLNGDLIVAGRDTDYHGVARWDGSGWHPMGAAFQSGWALDLCVLNGELFATGRETISPSVSAVKRWTGTTWVPVGDAFIDPVHALEVYGGELYAGGAFVQQVNDPTELHRLVKWNGQNWVEVAQGLNGPVTALLATPTGLVVGGFFTALGDSSLLLPGWTVYDGSSFSEPVADPDQSFIPSANIIVAHPISGFILSGSNFRSVWVDGDVRKEIHFEARCAIQYDGDLLLGGRQGRSYLPVNGICKLVEGTDQVYLDISNIAAALAPNSSLFRSKINGAAAFRVPRTGLARSISKAAPWVVGTHMGERYSASPYHGDLVAPQSGPYADVMDDDFFNRYHQVWKLDRTMIAYHADHWADPDYEVPHAILTWPGNGVVANGEPARIAPFADLNGNELYEPGAGEYPLIRGDQAIYSIQHSVPDQSGPYPLMQLDLGIMIHAYDEPANADLFNTVFANFTIIDRGPEDYTDVRFGLFTDLDLGNPNDDYFGCDSLQSLYYVYNADDVDEDFPSYGYGTEIPAQGVMFLNREMSAFTVPVGSPALEDMMNGTLLGAPFMQTGYPSHFQYPGGAFTQETAGDPLADRGSIGSIGPLTLNAGDTLCVDMAFPFALAPSGNRLESLGALMQRSAAIHAWYATQDVQCDEIPDHITHVPQIASLEMGLYPVPAQDQVTVRCPQGKTGAELQLLNGMGQVVRTLAWPAGREEMRVDLHGVPNGLYVVRLSSASERLTRSLVVLH